MKRNLNRKVSKIIPVLSEFSSRRWFKHLVWTNCFCFFTILRPFTLLSSSGVCWHMECYQASAETKHNRKRKYTMLSLSTRQTLKDHQRTHDKQRLLFLWGFIQFNFCLNFWDEELSLFTFVLLSSFLLFLSCFSHDTFWPSSGIIKGLSSNFPEHYLE